MALFQYTLIVLFFVMVVASTCISTFTVTHHRIYLWSAGLFTTYFFDVALVFRRIMVPPLTGTAVYEITSAPESILLGPDSFSSRGSSCSSSFTGAPR